MEYSDREIVRPTTLEQKPAWHTHIQGIAKRPYDWSGVNEWEKIGIISKINECVCILYRALWTIVRTLVLIIRTLVEPAVPFTCPMQMSNVIWNFEGRS